MRAYGTDLRERVVRLREKGQTQQGIAELLGLSVSTVKRYVQRQARTGSVAATVQKRAGTSLDEAALAVLKAQLKGHADATLAEHVRLFAATTGRLVSTMTLSRTFRRQGWTRKKRRSVRASETW